jgi:hypothetical protein
MRSFIICGPTKSGEREAGHAARTKRNGRRKSWRKDINYERVSIAVTLWTPTQDASYPSAVFLSLSKKCRNI